MSWTYLELLYGRSDWLKVLSYVIGAAYLLLSVLMMCSLKMTWRKYKLITRRNTMERWDQSYCLLSKHLVQIVLIGTPACIVLLVFDGIYFLYPYAD